MKKILLDTNMLMVPGQFGVDVFEEIDKLMKEKYQLITLGSIKKELETITSSRGKDAGAARVGLELIKRNKVKVIDEYEKADKAIIDFADENVIVATNDRVLQSKVKAKKGKVIYLRGKKTLEMR